MPIKFENLETEIISLLVTDSSNRIVDAWEDLETLNPERRKESIRTMMRDLKYEVIENRHRFLGMSTREAHELIDQLAEKVLVRPFKK
jgi:uncharacterized protein (UPF0305 family)